jgi:hypothetical protein
MSVTDGSEKGDHHSDVDILRLYGFVQGSNFTKLIFVIEAFEHSGSKYTSLLPEKV